MVEGAAAASKQLPSAMDGGAGRPETPSSTNANGASTMPPKAEDVEEEVAHEPTCLMQVMLCLVAAVEGADIVLIGSSLKALQEDIGLELMQVSYMTITQLVLTNLAAPFWGILADRGILRRRTILLLASCGQGLTVVAFAFMPNLALMVVCRAVDGALLAALRPISNGIVADVTSEHRRGKVFGRLQSGLIMGIFVTGLFVVPMATEDILGFQGWRVAFVIVGAFSLTVALLVGLFLQDPPHVDSEGEAKGFLAVLEELRSLLRFFRLPTFCVMIVQGIFGTLPWSVMGYMALFFQLAGIPKEQVAVITGAQAISGAVGNLLGGMIADRLSSKLGLHGRPLSAQITVACGIPIVFYIFRGIEPGTGSFGLYFGLMLLFGFTGTWAQSGTNFPILSHIVPPDCRSRVLAWESAFENSIANGLGPVIVAALANAFNYRFGTEVKEGIDVKSAKALGTAMTATICIPWIVCFVVYSMMHWTYPRDVATLEAQERRRMESVRAAKVEDPECGGGPPVAVKGYPVDEAQI